MAHASQRRGRKKLDARVAALVDDLGDLAVDLYIAGKLPRGSTEQGAPVQLSRHRGGQAIEDGDISAHHRRQHPAASTRARGSAAIAGRPLASTDKAHGIDIEQQRGRAPQLQLREQSTGWAARRRTAGTCYAQGMSAARTHYSLAERRHARRFWLSIVIALPLGTLPFVVDLGGGNFAFMEGIAGFLLAYGLLQTRSARERKLEEIARVLVGGVSTLGFVAFLDHQLYLVDSGQVESTTTFALVAAVYRHLGFWPAAAVLTSAGVGIVAAAVVGMATSRGWWGNESQRPTAAEEADQADP
jgi:hypothetical protein